MRSARRWFGFVALVLGLAFLLVPFVGAHGQHATPAAATAPPDTGDINVDSLMLPHYRLGKAVLLATIPIAAFGGGWLDRDPGGYRDSLRPTADKREHLYLGTFLGYAMTRTAADLTGHRRWLTPALGGAVCLAAGSMWESGQGRWRGYTSRQDIAYDAVGCATGAVWGHIFNGRSL
jgi:hypothetical protein